MRTSVARRITITALGISLGLVCLAAPARADAVLIHQYDLNGNYQDDLLGPALVDYGGTIGPTGYTFADPLTNTFEALEGLSLSNGIDPADYSIVIDFRFGNTTSYRKIIDFENLSSDNGLYVLGPSDNSGGALDFYYGDNEVFGPAGVIPAGTQVEVTLTRDGASKVLTGYVNGVPQFFFTDDENDDPTPFVPPYVDADGNAVFGGPDNIINFFMDDETTTYAEASGGFADEIRIYSGALTEDQVALLPGPTNPPPPGAVPEPASLLLLGTGLVAGALLRHKR